MRTRVQGEDNPSPSHLTKQKGMDSMLLQPLLDLFLFCADDGDYCGDGGDGGGGVDDGGDDSGGDDSDFVLMMVIIVMVVVVLLFQIFTVLP